ncbi:hypothetical protein E3H47_04615 [Acinetobacter radioresistens]|uniref:hypothetical protein n=1 Tax=Acinetobacter radioresistens TaxID=40216 RepID=UPI0010CCCC71|nr:hypothetical protein [Acinetobacter radioresistens]QCS11843.1 hypothetical protein E3H47_04615 [Acinetobacter radioresistens]
MNLIEQLGYEYAKEIYLSNLEDFSGNASGATISTEKLRFTHEELEKALLEYRRQHNIFEVGDKVIKTHPKNTILWPVLGVYKNGGVWLDYKGFCWKPPSVRHATAAEIEAGKRLEVV